jgi:hypothetical protein
LNINGIQNCSNTSCKHQHDQLKKKSNMTYLEKKFEEIFLKRFHLLPGFNDLFVFTSLMQNFRELGDELIEDENQENDEFDEENSGSQDSDDYENYTSDSDASSQFDEEPGVVDSENELNPVKAAGYYDESDSNDSQLQQPQIAPVLVASSKSSKLKKIKNLKSSSPYSSTTSVLNKLRTKVMQTFDGDGSSVTGNLNEQIIGLEMVCLINTEVDMADLDTSESSVRTRTTTLTTENISLDYLQVIRNFKEFINFY